MKLNNLTLLTNIKLSPDYEFTIDFNNIESQNNYFDSKKANVIYDDDSYSFFRYNESIKIDCNIEDLNEVNYLYYTNNSGKRYYCFVTSKEYIDDNVTIINIKCDILQTYMFNYRLGECFIERQHEDRIYIDTDKDRYHFKFNTEPENLDIGETYDVNIAQILEEDAKPCVLNNDGVVWLEVICTKPINTNDGSYDKPETWENNSFVADVYNVSLGYYIYLIPVDLSGRLLYVKNYAGKLGHILSYYSLVKSEAVLNIRCLSYSPVKYSVSYEGENLNYKTIFIEEPANIGKIHLARANNPNFGEVDLSHEGLSYAFNVNIYDETNALKFEEQLIPRKSFKIRKTLYNHNNKFKVYDVINYDELFESKLFTYPYNYLTLTDYKSPPLDIKFEYLNDYTPELDSEDIVLVQSLGLNYKSKIYVKNYHPSKGFTLIGDNGKEYNSCNTTNNDIPLLTNAYKQYMTQNRANATIGLGLNVAQTALTAGLGFATGGFGLAVAGVEALNIAGEIANNLIQVRDIKNTPDSVRQSGNNVIFDIQDNNILFKVYEKQLMIDYRNKIGRYFYFYGYASNKIEVPNVRSRWYFNYVKCANCNIISNIDNDTIEELKSIYNNGVTIKHIRNLESDSRIDDETFSQYQNTEFDIDNEINGGIL